MSANDTQVGGTHYRQSGKELQHWDLAVLYQWDPFQYQITKYVMRWKHKHSTHEERLRDLQKAAHFLQKYMEVAAQYSPPDAPAAATTATTESASWEDDWLVEGYFGDGTQEYKCRHCGECVRALSGLGADTLHGTCAGRGYVNQG